jgi:hypothetical protein
MMNHEELYPFRLWVIAVLERLGDDPDTQISYLDRLGVASDELLLEFDDVLMAARGKVHDGLISPAEYQCLEEVEHRVTSVNSAGDSIWSDSSIRQSELWADLREIAHSAKSRLSEYWGI